MTTLTDRYVWAVVRDLPADRRDDVDRELRSTIADMTEAHPDADERAVLMELGDPADLAAGFDPRPQYLVGPNRYHSYLRTLRLVVSIAVPALVALTILGASVDERGVADTVADSIGAAFTAVVQAAFWVTVAYVVIDRTSTSADDTWSPDDLPTPPSAHPIAATQTVLSIVGALAVIGLIVFQHVRSFVRDDGDVVPVLDPDLWDGWMWVVIGLVAAAIPLAIAVHRAGRWTVPLAVINAVLNLVLLAVLGGLALGDDLVNPDLLGLLAERADRTEPFDPNGAVIAAIVAAVLIWDAAEKLQWAIRERGGRR